MGYPMTRQQIADEMLKADRARRAGDPEAVRELERLERLLSTTVIRKA